MSASAERERGVDRAGISPASAASRRCAGDLAERHGLTRPAPCSRPSRRRRRASIAPASAALSAAASAKATGQVGAGGSAAERRAGAASALAAMRSHCASERPSARPAAQLARLARRRDPAVELDDAPRRRASPGRAGARRPAVRCVEAEMRAGRRASACARLRRDQAGFDARFEALGVAVAADRQARRGEAQQVQQRARRSARGDCVAAPASPCSGAHPRGRAACRRGRDASCGRAHRHGRAHDRDRAPGRVVGAGLGLERRLRLARRAAPCARSISASTWSGSSCRPVGSTSSGTCRLPRW